MAERTPLPTDEPVQVPPEDDRAAAAAPPAADDDLVTVPRSAKVLLWQARAGLGVGILGVLLAVAAFWSTTDARQAEATREAVLEAGEVTALRVTTFEGATIDDWVADTQRLATGAYAEEVAALFDAEIRRGLAENQVQSVGEITSAFVQDVRDDDAVVFAVVRQTFTSASQPQPISDELRMEIVLEEVDGEWRASDVAVLGPSTITPVDPAADPAAGDPAAAPAPTPPPTPGAQ